MVLSSHAELTDQQKQFPLEVDSTDPSVAKIVLIAGGISNNKPGGHEYFAGCSLLYKCLKQTPGVAPVMAAEGWPKNEAILKGAKCIVIYTDGGEKLPWLDDARWSKMREAISAGAGLICIHQAVEVPANRADEFKTWLGGVWQKDTGCRGHWDMTLKTAAQHPTLAGAATFDAPGDGWLYNLHFADTGVTPLLVGQVADKARTTADAKAHSGRDEVIGWAFERKDGGRSVGFTGADLHSSWRIDSQRRFMLNAILWTAKVNAEPVIKLDEADFTANMDKKTATAVKKVGK